MKTCERCGRKFKCQANDPKKCWCMSYSLSKATLAEIKSKYRDCLCRECLTDYAVLDGKIGSKRDRAPRKVPHAAELAKKGLLIVHTGGGKGKSTAAFGTALRALGQGQKVAMVQFLKGKWSAGELKAMKAFGPKFKCFGFGDGFTWETKNYARDVRTAERAWDQCRKLLKHSRYQLLIFDELIYCLKYNFLSARKVVSDLKKKSPDKHVILTGNGAPKILIAAADLVTEMKCVKHPYQEGISAQAGIEY